MMEKISLAQLNTPITKLEYISKELGVNIYMKHDELTGLELSGNKVRKLEYSIKEALDQNSDVIITCGALQSNHARATAIAARRCGLDVHLVLKKSNKMKYIGNHLIDIIAGANITYVDDEEFIKHETIMNDIKEDYNRKGKIAYIIPLGASNGVGTLGYLEAYNEITTFESSKNVEFDTIVCAIGSGGTYSGLLLGNHLNNKDKRIIGYSVGGSSEYFQVRVNKIILETINLLGIQLVMEPTWGHHLIVDKFQGLGYAVTTKKEIDFIKYIAKYEGIILDPVYTGKAFYGLYQQIKRGELNQCENILFIHTGGIFGINDFDMIT